MRIRAGLVVMAALLTLGTTSCTQVTEARIPAGYRQWERSTQERLDFVIPGHGSGLRVIYANDLAVESARKAGPGSPVRYAEGSIFVKEVYAVTAPAAGEDPSMLTVMVKDSTAPDNRGGWIWIVRPFAEPASAEARIGGEFCITCHANANEKHPYGEGNTGQVFMDYVFWPPLVATQQ